MKPRIPLHLRPPAAPPKHYRLPKLRRARFRVSTADYIDPIRAAAVVCDTGAGMLEVAYGHRIPIASMAHSRPTRRMLKALAANFGA